jgi:acetylornithine/succinyldiaminopimelate/putrescine aminotransferase
VFDVINTTEVLDGVKARHALFMEGLRTINARREVFVDIRGEGVWLGCELIERWQGKALDVMRAAAEAGLIVLVAGPDVVRIAPSLVISLDEILKALRDWKPRWAKRSASAKRGPMFYIRPIARDDLPRCSRCPNAAARG